MHLVCVLVVSHVARPRDCSCLDKILCTGKMHTAHADWEVLPDTHNQESTADQLAIEES